MGVIKVKMWIYGNQMETSGVILIETKQNLFKFEFCHKRKDVPMTE